MSQSKILVVDIDPVVRSGICNFLAANGHIVADASNCRDAEAQVQSFRPDAVILDLYLPSGDAPLLLQQVKGLTPAVPVLVLTGPTGSDLGARALRYGADQVLLKPVEFSELHAMLLRLLGRQVETRMLVSPSPKTSGEHPNPFIGSSTAIHRLHEIAGRVATSDSPILLQGETGSGKGVLANWIHRNSTRANRPFLDLNCAGLSRELLDSELFGYEKGAFTGAVSAKQGLLEVANRGTVFLDEIGDIDLQVQPKLLKVLEERTFRRLGDIRDRVVDIRLISATHRELLDLVRQQRFRSDLYFRVNIVAIPLPSLRERVEDISILAQHLLRNISRGWNREGMRISTSAMLALERYSWPGNIRELRNVLDRAVLLAGNDVVRPEHLDFQAGSMPALVPAEKMNGTLRQVERAYIHRVLHDEQGSVERAARRLGIPRSSLYNKMRRFEIPQGTGRADPRC